MLFLLILGITAYHFRYVFLVNEVSEKFIKEQFVGKQVKGRVSNIVKYGRGRIVLVLENYDFKTLTYGMLCIDESLIKKISIGDSVYKKVGTSDLQVRSKNGFSATFSATFCD